MTYLVEIRNIIKSYSLPGQVPVTPVLNDISLGIPANASIAIVGPSGSGKTTLLNILGTLDKPESGEVFIDGEPVGSLDDDQLAGIRNSRIGFVFQLHYLLPQLTLLENVLLPLLPVKDRLKRSVATGRAGQLLELTGLAEKSNRRPGKLSTGECQRAAVVRALINRPALLLADEPTGSLDTENASLMTSLLNTLKKEENLAMVVVTHSPELASAMETRYRLRSGKLEKA